MKTKIYAEICCDECNEIIHNHFNCPACNENNTPSSVYWQLTNDDKEIECELCGAEFVKSEKDNWYDIDLEINIIEKP